MKANSPQRGQDRPFCRAKAVIRLENRQALGPAFSQGFIRDFALVWAEEGLEAVRGVAKKRPVAIAARICPNDVRLTLEQAIPGATAVSDITRTDSSPRL
jgi:hypothetical protein